MNAASGPRLGFLGVGWIGKNRLEAIAASGLAQIAAVADTSTAATAPIAAAMPGTIVGRSLDDLLTADVDGVVIATPSALHAAQCIDAFAHGVAVFCQKPLARTAAEARAVVDHARAADRLLGVDFSYRHLESARAIRDLVGGGAVGDVFAIDLVFHNAYGPDKSWARDPGLAGGGCLIDLGVHLIDFALWVLDFPVISSAAGRLYANGKPVTRAEGTVEDFATATLQLATGATIMMSCSWHAHAGRDAIIRAAFHGTHGTALLKNVDGSFYDFIAEEHHGPSRRTLTRDTQGWGGHAAVSWVDALRRGAQFDPAAERFVDVALALDRIYAQ